MDCIFGSRKSFRQFLSLEVHTTLDAFCPAFWALAVRHVLLGGNPETKAPELLGFLHPIYEQSQD
jgi:hypothetical protein